MRITHRERMLLDATDDAMGLLQQERSPESRKKLLGFVAKWRGQLIELRDRRKHYERVTC